MVDLEKYFNNFINENGIDISLSFDMSENYEDANGMFDPVISTLFINKKMLEDFPCYEVLFYLFHELRHALQYLK